MIYKNGIPVGGFTRTLTIAMVVTVSIALFSCQPKERESRGMQTATVDTAAIMSAIDSLRSNYQSAVNSGNFKKLEMLVTSDHMGIQPGSADWDSMRANYRGAFPPNAKLQINPMETKVLSHNWAYEIGTGTLTYPTKDSDKSKSLSDTYMVLLKKTKDGWKVHREVSSSYIKGKESM